MSKSQIEEDAFHTADRAQVNLRYLYASRQRGARSLWEEVACLYCLVGQGGAYERVLAAGEVLANEVTFFSQEVFERLCAALHARKCAPSALRRNVIIEGVDLRQLIGKEFEIHGVRFEGTEACVPDSSMNKTFGPGAEDFLKGHGGLRARILCDGWIRSGPSELLVWGEQAT